MPVEIIGSLHNGFAHPTDKYSSLHSIISVYIMYHFLGSSISTVALVGA